MNFECAVLSATRGFPDKCQKVIVERTVERSASLDNRDRLSQLHLLLIRQGQKHFSIKLLRCKLPEGVVEPRRGATRSQWRDCYWIAFVVCSTRIIAPLLQEQHRG